jgi:hypothetical protein
MQNAQHVEIGFADRIDEVAGKFRHEGSEIRKIPGHHDAEREGEIEDREPAYGRRVDEGLDALRAAERAPGTEHEQKLPSERIEHPDAFGPGWDVPAEPQGQRIRRGRRRRPRYSRR